MRCCPELILAGLVLTLGGPLQNAAIPAARAAEISIPPAELVTTSPIMAADVLYIASFNRPEHSGHLRAFAVSGTPELLWDAAERMPAPGTGASPGILPSSDPPRDIAVDNEYRTLFTNRTVLEVDHHQPFAATQTALLQPALATGDAAETEALINRVRGRVDTSAAQVGGSGDAAHLLWGISRSTPAVTGRSLVAEDSAERDQVVYVGAEDGMLHAFHAGSWDPLLNGYNHNAVGAGRELWAYIPGSLLPWLKQQPFDHSSADIATHLDGSPAVGDYFVDLNGDGRRQWRTLLVGTGSLPALNRSIIFLLDVTDPYQPRVLWEHALPGINPGLSRGAVIGNIPRSPVASIFLTTGFAEKTDLTGRADPVNGRFGVQAFALDLLSGSLLWQWQSPYGDQLADINTTPSQPALLDVDGDGSTDYLVFGDMAGRLWAITAVSGVALGGGPVYTVANGPAEPIGAGVATHGRIAVFGTGGAPHADDQATYAIYAVEILPTGGQLLWSHALEPGEQVWDTPVLDRFGRIYFAASTDYRPADPAAASASGGRLIHLDQAGQELTSTDTDSAVAGQVRVASGLAVAVSLAGQIYQFGSLRPTAAPENQPAGPLRLFSWRLR